MPEQAEMQAFAEVEHTVVLPALVAVSTAFCVSLFTQGRGHMCSACMHACAYTLISTARSQASALTDVGAELAARAALSVAGVCLQCHLSHTAAPAAAAQLVQHV